MCFYEYNINIDANKRDEIVGHHWSGKDLASIWPLSFHITVRKVTGKQLITFYNLKPLQKPNAIQNYRPDLHITDDSQAHIQGPNICPNMLSKD